MRETLELVERQPPFVKVVMRLIKFWAAKQVLQVRGFRRIWETDVTNVSSDNAGLVFGVHIASSVYAGGRGAALLPSSATGAGQYSLGVSAH